MNYPNLISLLRIPLALLFIIPSTPLRFFILAIALATDGLDGYLARRWSLQTRLGAFLDPATDKFFVVTALLCLFSTASLHPWQIAAFFARDIAAALFALWLLLSHQIYTHHVRSIWPGKLTTLLQFATLALLTAGIPLDTSPLWVLFITLGAAFLLEFALHPRHSP